jgi:enamine deaminase RidA (YjgF/YER057c/UK114 family)
VIKKIYIKHTSNAVDFGQALQDVFLLLKPHKGRAFKLTAFVNAENILEFISKQKQLSAAIKSCFEIECPTWSMLSETPYKSTLCVVLQCSEAETEHIDFRGLPVVILKQNSEKELWASGLSSLDEDMHISANAVFEALSEVLEEHGFEYDDIVRQWTYIGEILKEKNKDGLCAQNYQVFNDIRNDYYRRNKKTSDFPAATGIGMKTQGLIVDIFAQKSCDVVQSLPLRSKIQKNPFAYSEAVLVGDKVDKKPPLFERARLLYSKHRAQIFVSGTASIKNQETVAIGNISAQTDNTIRYIKDLVSLQNIQDNYSEIRLSNQDYQRVRVYVKRRDDLETVFKICTAHFPEHVINVVEADICRDNLLVEIEADLVIN